MSADWRDFYEALRRETHVLQRLVNTRCRYVKHQLIKLLASAGWDKAFVGKMREKYYIKRSGIKMVRGEEAGFGDILGVCRLA